MSELQMVSFSADAAYVAPGGTITVTCKLKNISGYTIKYMSVFVGTTNLYDNVVGGFVTLDSVGNWKTGATKTFTWTAEIPSGDIGERSTPLVIKFRTNTSTATVPSEDTYVSEAVTLLNSFCTPKIEDFSVVRTPDDESSAVAVTIKLSQSEAAYNNALWAPACRLVYAANGYGSENSIDLTDRIADLLTGVTADTTIVTDEIDPRYDYDFAITFGDNLESAVGYTDVPNASAPFALSETGEGAAFGMFPTGNPWLETAYPLVPYNGIAGVNIYMPGVVLNEFVRTAGAWIENGIAIPIHRVTVTFGAMAKDTEQEIDIGIAGSTVDRIVSIDGMFSTDDGSWSSLMYSNDAGVGYHVRTTVINVGSAADNLKLKLVTGASRSISNGHATIAYTVKESDTNA